MDAGTYLARIGAGPDDDLATLAVRHFHAVPFENLSIHLDEPIDTDPAALFDKIVVRRRGGFCHELNGLFAWLLGELGHDVELLGARVHMGDGTLTPPLNHLALRVGAGDDGGPWLVDVGFGGFLVEAVDLSRPSSRVAVQDDGELEVRGPEGESGYRVDPRPLTRADFHPTCWWQSRAPDSHFTHGPRATLPTADGGRITLVGTRLVRTAPDGSRAGDDALTDGEALAAYRDHFGIVLDRLPTPLHPPAATVGG